MVNNSFGERLKNYRKVMRLTQTELGRILNVSQVTVAYYERGERFPKQDMLLAISNLFDVSLDTLLENNRSANVANIYPDGFEFNIETLIKMLMRSPLQDALTYTSGWRNKAELNLIDFYEKVISPILIKTGELWFKGEILVSEEHLISDKIRELILIHANRDLEKQANPPADDKQWMGFCAPGESHELALLMNAQSLRLEGWQVYYLGVHVPFKDLSGIIKKYKPDVLGISVTMPTNIEGLDMYIRQIRAEFGDRPAIIIGGQGLNRDSMKGINGINGSADSIPEGLKLSDSYIL